MSPSVEQDNAKTVERGAGRDALYHELRRLAPELIVYLKQFIPQRRLELLIGLSQGYLSRLRAGAGTPSESIICLLFLIAQDPSKRLLELGQLRGNLQPIEQCILSVEPMVSTAFTRIDVPGTKHQVSSVSHRASRTRQRRPC